VSATPSIRPKVTIREIADLAGVSVATVSRVMNGRDDVSRETRELVQRIVRERGYTANRTARGLSAGRTGLIGATVPRIHPAYFSFILSGAAEALYERDMRLVLCPTEHEHDREVSLLERMMHGTTDGGLLILPEESADELEHLLEHGYRFVVVDPLLPLNERIPAVSPHTRRAPTSRSSTCSRSAIAGSRRSPARAVGSRPTSDCAGSTRRSARRGSSLRRSSSSRGRSRSSPV